MRPLFKSVNHAQDIQRLQQQLDKHEGDPAAILLALDKAHLGLLKEDVHHLKKQGDKQKPLIHLLKSPLNANRDDLQIFCEQGKPEALHLRAYLEFHQVKARYVMKVMEWLLKLGKIRHMRFTKDDALISNKKAKESDDPAYKPKEIAKLIALINDTNEDWLQTFIKVRNALPTFINECIGLQGKILRIVNNQQHYQTVDIYDFLKRAQDQLREVTLEEMPTNTLKLG